MSGKRVIIRQFAKEILCRQKKGVAGGLLKAHYLHSDASNGSLEKELHINRVFLWYNSLVPTCCIFRAFLWIAHYTPLRNLFQFGSKTSIQTSLRLEQICHIFGHDSRCLYILVLTFAQSKFISVSWYGLVLEIHIIHSSIHVHIYSYHSSTLITLQVLRVCITNLK